MKIKCFIPTCCLMLAFFVTITFGGNAFATGKGGRHHGPPPEAFTACEDKTEGDIAEFIDPRGETITGTCELQRERLVLRPDNAPDNGNGPNSNGQENYESDQNE